MTIQSADLNQALERQLEQFLMKQPVLGREVFVAPGAVVLGDVTLGDYSSVWFNSVLRGDINRIVVGHHTNIQDNCVFHMADEFPCIVGNFVTVGHGAIIHACTIEDEVLVGMRAVVMDGARIGTQCVIGAGAVVPPGLEVPAGAVVLGVPAKVERSLTPEEREKLRGWAEKYVEISRFYKKNPQCLAGLRGV